MAKDETPKPIHQRLMEGIANLVIKSREDGTVHTLKAPNGKTIGEVVVGKSKTRLNFKSPVPADHGVENAPELGGRSKSWTGGGCTVTDENLTACKSLIRFVVQANPAEAEEPEAPASTEAEREAAAEAVKQTGRGRGARKPAAAAS